MRILFLDVDGVLNSDPSKRGGRPTGGVLGVEWAPTACLAEIVRKTGAFIVLTSTWKRSWGTSWQPGTLRYLTDKLRTFNIEIMGCTTEETPSERGKGIRKWLEYHGPVEGWAVLDDDIFPDYAQHGILPRLIKTNFYRGGLTQDKIEPCADMLNTPPTRNIGCGCCPQRKRGELPDKNTQVVTNCAEAACPINRAHRQSEEKTDEEETKEP